MPIFNTYYDGTSTPAPAADNEYVYIEHTTQTTLNQSNTFWTVVQMNAATLDTNIAGVAASATEITGLPDGRYEINGQIQISSTVLRTNILLRVSLDGNVVLSPTGGSGYIRASQGANTSSVHTGGRYVLTGGTTTVRLIGQREANSGLVVTQGGAGMLEIVRLAA